MQMFGIALSKPTVCFDETALLATCGGDTARADGVRSWLLSRDYNALKTELRKGDGTVCTTLDEILHFVKRHVTLSCLSCCVQTGAMIDGQACKLKQNMEFFMSTADMLAAKN